MAADFIITITDRSRGGEFAAWFQDQGTTLVLTALGISNMWFAIFADVGVMILAVLNAIRALWVKNL